jgi:hypothetical protein
MANTTGTTQIPEFFTTEFTANWEHLVQQKMSKLREWLSITTIKGKEKSFNQIGPVTMTAITERVSETTITDTPMYKRWIRPTQYEKADLLDEWDSELLGEVSLPNSDLISAHAMAYLRSLDEIALAAAVGTAYTGETGVTATTLPSGQKVAVDYVESGTAANSGLTVAKLRQASFILNDNNVDDSDPRIIVVSAKQLQDLLRDTSVTSADFNTVRALVQGEIDTFMGFKFRRVDKDFFAYDSGTGVRKIVAYAKSGIKLADSGRKVHVDIRPDRSHALQIRTVASIGATRMEEEKVVEIACDEVL